MKGNGHMDDYKHYVTVDSNGYIIDGFVEDGTRFATETDHYIGEGIRQFALDLRDHRGMPLYVWRDGKMKEASDAERQAWIAALPAKKPDHEDRLLAIEKAILGVALGESDLPENAKIYDTMAIKRRRGALSDDQITKLIKSDKLTADEGAKLLAVKADV